MTMSEQDFKENLRATMQQKAEEGRCGLRSECEKDVLTIYVLDENGKIIHHDSGHILNDHGDKKNERTRSEWVRWLFENGLQDKYTIYTVREQTENRVYYSPEEYKKIEEEEIKFYESRVKYEEETKKRKEERNARWREGCDWVRSFGGTTIREGHCRRQTLILNVVKLGITESWNAKYPEFRVSEYEESQYEKYLNQINKKKKGGKNGSP